MTIAIVATSFHLSRYVRYRVISLTALHNVTAMRIRIVWSIGPPLAGVWDRHYPSSLSFPV
jgi:hypothetical protein